MVGGGGHPALPHPFILQICVLRVTSQNNEKFSSPVIFRTFSDAARELGFTEQGIGKAYRSKKPSMKNSSGKYDFAC